MNSFREGRVTIGIPTRNRSGYLVRALASALAQTYANIEVVVSDNASTDDTAQRIEQSGDARVVFLRQPANIGMVENFNACLTAATGELFLLLSDDDVLDETAIERLSGPFYTPSSGVPCSSIGMTWSPCMIIDAEGQSLWPTEGGPAVESSISLLLGLYNGKRGPRFSSVMVRTADALSVGGYNGERHGAICDFGNWSRVALRYDFVACVDRPLVQYTVHMVSETSKSTCAEWQQFGENVFEDSLPIIRARQDLKGEMQLKAAKRNYIANLILTILLQTVGRRGWVHGAFREIWRARSYFFTWFIARRLFRDGSKLLRLRRRPA